MNSNKESMENSKLITILVQLEEGTKTPFKAHNEILSLFGVVKRSEQLKTFAQWIINEEKINSTRPETYVKDFLESL